MTRIEIRGSLLASRVFRMERQENDSEKRVGSEGDDPRVRRLQA
jgi:hypothetical protein